MLISGDVLSAFLWFNGRQFHSNSTSGRNFIIEDGDLQNVKRRHRDTYSLQENGECSRVDRYPVKPDL